jgi:hypothetical protein
LRSAILLEWLTNKPSVLPKSIISFADGNPRQNSKAVKRLDIPFDSQPQQHGRLANGPCDGLMNEVSPAH